MISGVNTGLDVHSLWKLARGRCQGRFSLEEAKCLGQDPLAALRRRQVAATVSNADHVRGVAPRIEFYGMVSNGQKSGLHGQRR